MGPKRRLKKRAISSSPESSGDELLNSDTDVKLDIVQKTSDEESCDDPGTIQKGSEKTAETKQKDAEEETGLHTCIMSHTSELQSQFKSSRCNTRNPAKIPFKDIISHYYLHYRHRGHWDKVVPPSPAKQIEYYQCKLCDQKFRARLKTDSEPARASFLYHYATQHGKIIDAMREDREVDMTRVLNILNKHNFDIRKYILEGTDPEFDGDPCIIRELSEWNRTLGRDNQQIVSNRHLAESLACPKNDRSDCKDLDRNKDPTTLKLHLFYHYLDYWKDTVPEMISKDAKCFDCMKRITAETPAACRISMICHRAIIHGELKLAIEDDPDEFDEDLFKKIFSQNNKPVQVLYSKTMNRPPSENQVAVQENRPPTDKRLQKSSNPSVGSIVEKSSPKKKAQKKSVQKKISAEDNSSSSEEEERDNIPTQPYVRKRLKQDLSGVTFDDDSDEDSDWESRKKKRISSSPLPRREVPKRSRASVKQSLQDLSDSE